MLNTDVLHVYRTVGAVDSQFVLLSYFTNISVHMQVRKRSRSL